MLYLVKNAAAVTTAAPTKVATGTAIKTLLQVKPLVPCKIVAWGASFDGVSAATPGVVELIETGTVGATITQYATADIDKIDAEAYSFGDPTVKLIDVSTTTSSGFTSTGEGAITATRLLDGPQLIGPTNQFIEQFPLGNYPYVPDGKVARIRVTFGTSVSGFAYMILAF